jgi:hypothetical protein
MRLDGNSRAWSVEIWLAWCIIASATYTSRSHAIVPGVCTALYCTIMMNLSRKHSHCVIVVRSASLHVHVPLSRRSPLMLCSRVTIRLCCCPE